jgi:hypothetical protein
MSNRNLVLGVLAAVTFGVTRPSLVDPKQNEYAISLTGEFHGDEVALKDGEKILVLSIGKGQRSSLTSDVVRIEMVHDPIVDEDGEKSGKYVTLQSGTEGRLFLLRGNFREGSVEDAKTSELDECIDRQCEFGFGGKAYTIKVVSVETVEVDPEPLVKKYTVVVDDGVNSTMIDGVRKIVWAGDLDGDQELDIIYDDSFHYNVMSSLHLLLSSSSPGGSVLKEVASFMSVGC